jgi:hypothetical protein
MSVAVDGVVEPRCFMSVVVEAAHPSGCPHTCVTDGAIAYYFVFPHACCVQSWLRQPTRQGVLTWR